MSIGERIKSIRMGQKIKQGDAAVKIGIKQGSLSDIERGKVNIVTDRVIKDVCREFNVNEEWLRTGIGEVYNSFNIDFEEFLLTNASQLDELDRKIIQEYIKLKPNQRNVIKEYISKLTI